MIDHISAVVSLIGNGQAKGDSFRALHASVAVYVAANMAPDNQEDIPHLACGMTRAILKVLPNPANKFQIDKTPSLGRNDPCVVGLGCKHKQCCGGLPDFPAIDSETCWWILCQKLPLERVKAAVDSARMSNFLLASITDRMLETDPERVVAMLLPRFDDKLIHQNIGKDKYMGEQLRILCDAYVNAGKPAGKFAILERVASLGVGQLKSDALQWLATQACDRGEVARAWTLFEAAKEASPHDPALAHLEVLMLKAQGDDEGASECARSWIDRFHRAGLRDEEIPHVDWLRRAAEDPDFLFPGEEELNEWKIRFFEAVDAGLATPITTTHLRVVAVADRAPLEAEGSDDTVSEVARSLIAMGVGRAQAWEQAKLIAADLQKKMASGELEVNPPPDAPGATDHDQLIDTDASMRALEQEWHRAWPVAKPLNIQATPQLVDDIWSPPAAEFWIPFLEQHPEAFNSLDILDDIMIAATLLGEDDEDSGDAYDLTQSIAARVNDLLMPLLKPGVRLPWLLVENRPLLRLLVAEAYANWEEFAEDAVPCLQRLLALNPNDNHNLRELLLSRLLQDNDDAAALALCEKYPDDVSVDMSFGRVLALYRTDQLALAAAALQSALKLYPLVRDDLLDGDFDFEEPFATDVMTSSEDAAMIYVANTGYLWRETPGAIEWVEANSRAEQNGKH